MDYRFSYLILNQIFTSEVFLNTIPFEQSTKELITYNAALKLLEIGKDEIKNISANRYLIESLEVSKVPSIESLQNIHTNISYINHKNIIAEHASQTSEQDYENLLKIFIKDNFTELNDLLDKYTNNDKLDIHLLNIKEHGYAIIPNLINASKCDHIRKIVLDYAEKESSTEDAFFYGSRNNLQRIYHLLLKLPELNFLLRIPEIRYILSKCFERETLHEKYYLASWHANIIPYLGEAQKSHIDAAVPDPIPPWLIRMNANYISQDVNEENGSTMLLPGSHKYCRKPKTNERENEYIPLNAKKGSVVLWDGHVWHRSGSNNLNEPRVALLACFAASHLREMCMEEDNLRLFAMNGIKPPEELNYLLGPNHGIKSNSWKKKLLQLSK